MLIGQDKNLQSSAGAIIDMVQVYDRTLTVNEITKCNGQTLEPRAQLGAIGFATFNDEASFYTYPRPVQTPVMEASINIKRTIGLKVRLIQQGAFQSTFYIDNFKLSQDSILWSVSNDDGQTYYRIHEVLNKPYASLTFPARGDTFRAKALALDPNDWISGAAFTAKYDY